MEFFDVINKRYSHRTAFKNEAIPDEDIRKIIDAGIKAPSGMNEQTTSFIVVTDSDLRKKISDVLPTEATRTAPVIIAVLSEHVVTACGMAFETEDYASATVSMLLAVAASGYASVWMDGMTKNAKANTEIKKILQIPENKTLRTILPVGIPEKEGKQRERKSFEERCSYNLYK